MITFMSWTFGNFMCYFINQHTSFPGTKIVRERTEPDGRKHMRLKATAFEGYRESVPLGEATRENYNKMCFMAYPHHPIPEIYIEGDWPEDISLSKKDVSRIILTYNQNVHSVLIDRFNDGQKELDMIRPAMQKHYDRLVAEDYNCMLLNSNEIMQMNESEYLKLCEFIGEQPLSNWKDMIKEYCDNIGIKPYV